MIADTAAQYPQQTRQFLRRAIVCMKISQHYCRAGNNIVALRNALLIYYTYRCAELRFPQVVANDQVLLEEVKLTNEFGHTNRSGFCSAKLTMKTVFLFGRRIAANLDEPNHTLSNKIAERVNTKTEELMGINATHSFGKKLCADSPYDTALQVRSGDIFKGEFDKHGTYVPGKVHPFYRQPSLSFFMNCIGNSTKTIAVIEGPIRLEDNPVAVVLNTICETKSHDKLDCFVGDFLTSLYYLNCASHVCHGTSTMVNIYRNRFNHQRLTAPGDSLGKWTNTDAERYAMLT